MTFAGKVWRLLVGVKDGLVLLFMLLFFMLLYGVLSARPGAGQVRDGALLINLDGAVVEEPAAADPFRSTDFRDVFGTILQHWLALSPATILSSILPVDAGDPASYWTTANFDMGFLP